LFAAVGTLQDPAALASLLSYTAQLYLNPVDSTTLTSYPWELKVDSLEPLARLLPAPLSDNVIAAINNIANSIGNALSALPDPSAAAHLLDDIRLTQTAGQALYAAQLTVGAPVDALARVASWLGYAPALVEATVESALQRPADIPGLVSNLIYNVLNPTNYGLVAAIALPFVHAAFFAPAPIGSVSFINPGLIGNAYVDFSRSLNDALAKYLPAPITPTPFPSGSAATAATAARRAGAAQTVTLDVQSDPAVSDSQSSTVSSERKGLAKARATVVGQHKADVVSGVAADSGNAKIKAGSPRHGVSGAAGARHKKSDSGAAA
jgi:hypothetical protein